MQQVDLRRGEPRHAEQFEKPRRNIGAHALEVARFAGGDHLAENGEDGGPDTRDLGELSLAIECAQVIGVERGDGAGRALVGATAEAVLAAELEIRGQLVEVMSGGVGVHDGKYTATASTS